MIKLTAIIENGDIIIHRGHPEDHSICFDTRLDVVVYSDAFILFLINTHAWQHIDYLALRELLNMQLKEALNP